jgi:hypothetical protein
MRPLTGYVTPYPLILNLFKNSNLLAVVTEIIHRRLFGWRYHLFEPTVMQGDLPNVFTQKIQQMPHPAYSPDPALSVFFLFGYITRKSTEYDIFYRQTLKSAITHIFDEVGQETLIAVFETWTNGLEWVIEHEWEYFHQQMKNERKCLKIQWKTRGHKLFDPL